jgi:predicted lipoprotein with Yx(FWY)xxD motif
MRKSGFAAIAFAAIAVVGVAGCGNNSSSNTATTTQSSGSGAATIEMSNTSLGDVLTDGSGMTLYLFTKDTGTKSVCEGECAAIWPALEGKPAAGAGVDASLIGTTQRSDGSTQATYGGHPIYYFSQDSSAGDVNGQGYMGIWWVIDASGAAIEQASSSTSSAGGKY